MVGREEREPRYAWVVVAVLFLANAVASGTQGSFGLLVRPWETDFGWERAAISLTASIGFVVYGTSQALSGRWADRVGPRTIFASGLVILGIGTAALGSIVTLWQAYLVFGVLMSIGFGAASSSTSAVAIAHWFTATARSRRGDRRRWRCGRPVCAPPGHGGIPAGCWLANRISLAWGRDRADHRPDRGGGCSGMTPWAMGGRRWGGKPHLGGHSPSSNWGATPTSGCWRVRSSFAASRRSGSPMPT